MMSHQKGFTLIETILYMAIASSLIGLISVFFIFVQSSRVKSQTIMEVEEQGSQVMSAVTRLIRSSDAINSPEIGTSSGTLSLDMYDDLSDPTVIESNGSTAQVKVADGASVNLTNDKVRISAISFTNRGLVGTPGSIDISFTVEYINPNGRSEYDYSRTFTSAATIR
jgi:type II secretory pathway pseudopilin PulG